MRTTIIPAQITTVEDKIAGSLNLAQILILMAPVLLTALIYALIWPVMKFTTYKLIAILITTIICFFLSLRIKEKIVAQWLGVLVSYRLRPKYYLFNKNDLTERTVDVPEIANEPRVIKKVAKNVEEDHSEEIALIDRVKLENLISSGKVAFHYQLEKKHL